MWMKLSGNVCDGYNLRIHHQLLSNCLKLYLKYGLLRFCFYRSQKSFNVILSYKIIFRKITNDGISRYNCSRHSKYIFWFISLLFLDSETMPWYEKSIWSNYRRFYHISVFFVFKCSFDVLDVFHCYFELYVYFYST